MQGVELHRVGQATLRNPDLARTVAENRTRAVVSHAVDEAFRVVIEEYEKRQSHEEAARPPAEDFRCLTGPRLEVTYPV